MIPDWNSLDSVRRAHSDLEAAALVFFALLVLFDILAHLAKDDKKKTLLEKIGLSCFAVAVFAEIAAYPYGQRNDALSAQVIGSLSDKADEANKKAKEAISDSSIALSQAKDALSKAGTAETSLAKAEDEANKAQLAASNALGIAREARKEADSFEKDIVSAKKLATDAESHLAEALRQAAQAESELNRIRSPRSLAEAALSTALAPFQGTEYTMNVFQDDESIQFTKMIDGVLSKAGWIRKQPASHNLGITYFNIFSQDFKDAVPVCVETGIQVHVRAKQPLEVLQSTPVQKLPKTLQAANALRVVLERSVLPSDERNVGKVVQVDKEQGEGPVSICVGKKP